MSTYREAIHHARAGGTARLGGKEIRFLTFEEAEALILEHTPSVRTVHDDETNQPIVDSDGKMVVEMFADPRFDTKRLGLYDVGVHPATPHAPIEEDIYSPVEFDDASTPKPRVLHTEWVRVGIDDVEVPEVVAPEIVDEVLHEEVPQ